MLQFGRVISEGFAIQILQEWLQRKSLEIHVVYEDTSKLVSHVELLSNGYVVSCGSGKGSWFRVGALAEAIEHYMTEFEDDHPCTRLLVSEISSQREFARCGILRSLELYDSELSVFEMISYADSANSCYVPAKLCNPFFYEPDRDHNKAYEYISRYSSNSGIALGMTLHDALLHAVCEQIERHYLSHLFFHIIGESSNVDFVKVNLQNLSGFASSRVICEREVSLVLSSTLAGIHFCAAIGESEAKGNMPLIGSGASLNAGYAIQRATSEYEQLRSLELSKSFPADHASEDDVMDAKAAEIFQNYSQLSGLQQMDIEDLGLEEVGVVEDLSMKDPSAKGILDHISKQLSDNQMDIFYRLISSKEDPFCVVSVWIPSLERFHHIRSGLLVSPQRWLFQNCNNP